jgi:hypothetical protein
MQNPQPKLCRELADVDSAIDETQRHIAQTAETLSQLQASLAQLRFIRLQLVEAIARPSHESPTTAPPLQSGRTRTVD